MKVKNLSIVTLIALSQLIMAIPISAAEAHTEQPQSITTIQDIIDEGIVNTSEQGATRKSADQLIMQMDSNIMIQDGITYFASQPMTVTKGVSYVAIRALVDRVGYRLTYDSSTKETIIIKGNTELRFLTNSKSYTVNGVKKSMKGAAYQHKNTFMVPLTAITQALEIPYTVNNSSKQIILTLARNPIAQFAVAPLEIYATQTLVTYTTQASSPIGLPIVEERWEGKEDIFQEAGVHTVTYAVKDSSGEWSDPYSLAIHVLEPNQPPVALFTTNKEEYKMGELITLTDQSSDDGGEFTSTWHNNARAFFVPGPATIGITVTDKLGLTSYFEKTINITNETLYSFHDFNLLYTPIGDKFRFVGAAVPSVPKFKMMTRDEPSTLIRSNSPETVNAEGILYQDIAAGDARFMLHHVNNMSVNMKLYAVATNVNLEPVNLTTLSLGIGGPSSNATATGWKSIVRYLSTMQTGELQSTVTLQPGESQLILTELKDKRMKPGDILSVLADVYSDYPLQYSILMIDETKDPLLSLPSLPLLEWDGVHNRGTYPNSSRMLEYNDIVGESASRIQIGDNVDDLNLMGIDPIRGAVVSNSGNFGVLYKIKFNRVAPHTLVSFNPRGGSYSGAALVNGSLVNMANGGLIQTPDEQSVLYRTGSSEQSIEIWLSIAPGSNLPVNILFTPLPALK
jgi:PKD repeat protein